VITSPVIIPATWAFVYPNQGITNIKRKERVEIIKRIYPVIRSIA